MSQPFDYEVWTAANDWLQQHHRTSVTPAYPGTSCWTCSCGAGDHLRIMPTGVARSAQTRHLTAQHKRRMNELLIDKHNP